MSKPLIFIDGSEGTTGLQLAERLKQRDDIEMLSIASEKRKDTAARKELLNSADIVFLCLPDAAAREAVELIDNLKVRVIDASTAHRTNPLWSYGFPELSGAYLSSIAGARLVANPGCHASGALSSLAVLAMSGVTGENTPVSIFSLTGYSGGGKKMIAQYQDTNRDEALASPRIYSTAQQHKHLPEIMKHAHLALAPVFCPIVGDYYAGMATTVCLHANTLEKPMNAKDIHSLLAEHYNSSRFIKVLPFTEENLYLNSNHLVGTNMMEISVCGSGESITITSRFDNLGKGASGSAVQNMNILLGLAPDTYLV